MKPLVDAFGERNSYIIVSLAVTGFLLIGAWWVIIFVTGIVEVPDDTTLMNDALSPIYVNYQVDVDEWVSAESYLAMGDYQRQHENPRNVQVLTGLTTQEINGYMMNYFVAGLNVNCTYCHNINNFAAGPGWEGEAVEPPTEGDAAPHPEWEANKANAIRHAELVQDLNRNWLSQLDGLTDQKQPSGAQIVCATCHNGVAQMEPWPADQTILPDDYRLPLDEEYDLTAENQGILNVNARTDISLDTVQYQQLTMYHMNQSLNVGCTHCHNSRYFPSREVPAIHYAQNMLQMTQYIWLNYSESMAGKEPSCNMCHYGNVIPSGAVRSADIMPQALVPEGN